MELSKHYVISSNVKLSPANWLNLHKRFSGDANCKGRFSFVLLGCCSWSPKGYNATDFPSWKFDLIFLKLVFYSTCQPFPELAIFVPFWFMITSLTFLHFGSSIILRFLSIWRNFCSKDDLTYVFTTLINSLIFFRPTRRTNLWVTGHVTWCCVWNSLLSGRPQLTSLWYSGCLASPSPQASLPLCYRHAHDRTTCRWTRSHGSLLCQLWMTVTLHSNRR